jgi:archaellum component FlaC
VLLTPVEIAIDHLKDLMTSSAFGTLGAEVGDLKDGQARLGKAVNAHGKKLGEMGDKLDGVGNRVGNLEGEVEGLGDRVGSLEEGLGHLKGELDGVRSDVNGLKSDLETQGRELRQAMGEIK